MTGAPGPRHRARAARTRVAAAVRCVAVLLVVGAVGVTAASAAPPTGATAGASAATCEPGSGPDLSGRTIDAGTLAEYPSLACATLTGADLSGLSLIQDDLTGVSAAGADLSNTRLGQADLIGADLTGADLTGADLTQANLTGANLTGARAVGADFGQVTAPDVTFAGADLTDATFVQATLTDADFDGATMGGADFIQAQTDGASFTDVQGLVPWNRYLLFASLVVFGLAALFAVRKALRRRSPPEVIGAVGGTGSGQPVMAGTGYPDHLSPAGYAQSPSQYQAGGWGQPAGGPGFQPINASARSIGRGLVMGLLGAALIAFGFHLFLGGLIGLFSFAFDSLATLTCTGPLCAVGIDSGMFGPWGGIFAMIAGFWVLAKA